MERSPSVEKRQADSPREGASPQRDHLTSAPLGARMRSGRATSSAPSRPSRKAPEHPRREAEESGLAARTHQGTPYAKGAERTGTTRPKTAATHRSKPSEKEEGQREDIAAPRRRKAKRRRLTKFLSPLAQTRIMAKKAIRNIILYPVAIVALSPALVFRHNIYLLVLYLFIWTNIVLAVAIFLDELFDLPRKK